MRRMDRLSDDDVRFYNWIIDCLKLEATFKDDDMALMTAIELEEQQRSGRKRKFLEDCDSRLFSEKMGAWSNNEFRHFFRISRQSYANLCIVLCESIGEDDFKPEAKLVLDQNTRRLDDIHTCGGRISGETRVALFLRLLSGSSYFDLMQRFKVKQDPIFRSFRMVCGWINRSFKFPLMDALETEDIGCLESLSTAFAYECDSDGEFYGCIGALDGMAVRITKPTVSKSIPNPDAYFCRQSSFALNCQAICDAEKRFIWVSSKHAGSCHDSVAFAETDLYSLLQKKQQFLRKHGFFLVGDSAYNLESFLLVPFNNEGQQHGDDEYNFYHDGCHINVECAFGELVMRFGLFWQPLQFGDVAFVADILNAACLLHNFILDEGTEKGYINIMKDSPSFSVCHSIPAVTGIDAERPVGCPTAVQNASRELGDQKRLSLTISLLCAELSRPEDAKLKYNDFGLTYYIDD